MTARVTIFRCDRPARQVLLEPARTYLIGRSPDCDIRIDDPELSRNHARLAPDASNGWRIEDLGSKNGVVVGGHAIVNATLPQDAWIGLGSLACRFEVLSDEQRQRAFQQSATARSMTADGLARIQAADGVADILDKLLASVLSVSSTDRGFAMLTQPDGDLEIACSKGVDSDRLGGAEFEGSRGAIREALSTRRCIVTCDAASHEALAKRQSVVASQVRALVCLPLTVFDRVVGLIYADSLTPGKIFTELDVRLLEELGDHAATVIATAQLADQLDGVDRQLGARAATAVRLATMRHRIPDVARKVPGGRPIPMTGVRWSRIEARV